MSATTLGFFIAGLLAVFLLALAVQMRLLAGLALKRAAKAEYEELEERTARFAVVQAVNGPDTLEEGDTVSEAANWLAAEYPGATRHIRMARRGTMIMPGIILVIALAWRLTAGGA